MNAKDKELRHLRDKHPELWKKLLNLENEENLAGPIWNTRTKTSLHNKEEQFHHVGETIKRFINKYKELKCNY